MRLLLLGGTGEARGLAALLVAEGVEVTTSLAGRVADPALPPGAVRVGGFGGAAGLGEALRDYDAVVDATHPFAAGISANAAAACRDVGVPLLRLERPGWPVDPAWHLAGTHDEAAARTAVLGERPFLTVGRQQLGRFVEPLREKAVLARVVDAPALEPPTAWRLLRSRGPYLLESELDVMRGHRADVLVSKNSGGDLTVAKLEAARVLGIPVVVVRRPPAPAGVSTVSAVADAAGWVRGLR